METDIASQYVPLWISNLRKMADDLEKFFEGDPEGLPPIEQAQREAVEAFREAAIERLESVPEVHMAGRSTRRDYMAAIRALPWPLSKPEGIVPKPIPPPNTTTREGSSKAVPCCDVERCSQPAEMVESGWLCEEHQNQTKETD